MANEAAQATVESNSPRSSDLAVIDSPQEYDPALEMEHRPSRQIDRGQSTYRVYKRRFFGLFQLVLLNIIVSWDWLSYSPVSKTSAEHFKTSETAINWLSTSFLFAFCVAAPFTLYILKKAGPKAAIIVASCLLLAGNWIRYGGTRAGNFGATMVGQILLGLAQPFLLSVPTRYSDLWFSEKGRVSATAVASLANPFGGALGQLIDPMWATKASEIPNMVLYISIIVGTPSDPIPTPIFSRLETDIVPLVYNRLYPFLLHPRRTAYTTKSLRSVSHKSRQHPSSTVTTELAFRPATFTP